MRSSFTIPVAIVIGGIIVATALYASMPNKSLESDVATLVRPVGAADHILGNPAAQVMIVEYSDFDCDFCKGFHETLKQLIADEGVDGDVAVVFRHFPLSEIHPNALAHAKAAECAAEVTGNDAFWRFADALFAAQPADPTKYGTLAKVADIPGEAFATCYASESATKPLIERIMADRENALLMDARGTPFSVIITEGKLPVIMDGAYPYGAVKELVDEALAN